MVLGKSLLAGFFAATVWGQTADKVFYFAHIDSPQGMQEISYVVRAMGEIRDLSADAAKRSLMVKGTADQIALAGWLAAELDKPGSAPGTRDFPFNDPQASLTQVVYLNQVDNPQQLQEMVNAVRSATDIQRCFPMNQQKAIVMRASPEQVKAADWVLGQLDPPSGAQTGGAAPREYRLPEGTANAGSGLVMRAVAITHLDTPQAIQEAVKVSRGIAGIQRLYPIFSRRVLVMRGNDDQIALASWLLTRFDSGVGQGTTEFKVSGAGNQLAQVAYVSPGTAESLLETVLEIRNQTNMPQVFPFNPQSAVVMRGTPDQLARAQQVIQSRRGR